MMVMTAKVNMKKVMMALAAVAAVILALILLLDGNKEAKPETSQTTGASQPSAGSNDSRVQFLKDYGWEVTPSPTESSQVKIPTESSPVFDRYNTLQKSQGYVLSQFAGKNVMRYVYRINNLPGATGDVYATLLVYKNEIIGGDVTDTSVGGKIRGFKMPQTTAPLTQPTTPAATAQHSSSESSAPAA